MNCKKCGSSNTKIRDKRRELYLCQDCNRHFNKNSTKLRGVIINDMKWCNKCQIIKPISEFFEGVDRGKKRIKSPCKQCFYERQLLTKYRKYNLSKKDFENLLLESDYKCNICEKDFKQQPKHILYQKLYIDHCHKTNKVRGLLCNNCNSFLGLAKDDINILKKAITYLKKI
jgi:transposase-like protein